MEQTFGERLRMIRRRRGMTQADLAKAMGITVQTVVRYEGLGLEEVRPARLKAFADALGVGTEELTGEFSGEEDIQSLTRGLRNMDPEKRAGLIRLMMPFILQHQKENRNESD